MILVRTLLVCLPYETNFHLPLEWLLGYHWPLELTLEWPPEWLLERPPEWSLGCGRYHRGTSAMAVAHMPRATVAWNAVRGDKKFWAETPPSVVNMSVVGVVIRRLVS